MNFLIIETEDGLFANTEKFKEGYFEDDEDLVNRVIEYINIKNKEYFIKIILKCYESWYGYLYDNKPSDILYPFRMIDKYYIQNAGLNKLIYLKNGNIKFTNIAKTLSQKYKIQFELYNFPKRKPLYTFGEPIKEKFIILLELKLNLLNFELEELKNSLSYSCSSSEKIKSYFCCDNMYLE